MAAKECTDILLWTGLGGKYFLCRLGEEWRVIACVPQHAPKIILGVMLLRTWDIKIARLILIFNLQHYTIIQNVEFLFTEDNTSVDNEEQFSEYFYDVSNSNMLNNITLDILFSLT